MSIMGEQQGQQTNIPVKAMMADVIKAERMRMFSGFDWGSRPLRWQVVAAHGERIEVP